MAKCVYKKNRKGERDCPALGGDICSQCCGRHRLTEIDCPYSCRWLKRAVKQQRDKVFDSKSTLELPLLEWYMERIVNGTGPTIPAEEVGLIILLELLELVHYELKQKEQPKMHKGVVRDSFRYVKQERTGKLVSTENPPSDLARILKAFLDRLGEGEELSPFQQKLEEQLLAALEDSMEWCEQNNLEYFTFLDDFYTEFSLDGWKPVKKRGGEYVFPQDEAEGEELASGRQAGDEELFVPGE